MSRHSVLGTFIKKYWQDRVDELDRKIETALTGVPSEFDDNRSVGKKTKYSLGTCAKIFDGGNTYVLVVTTEKNSNGQSILLKKDYPKVIGELFTYLELIRPARTIYLPMFGTGRGKMKRSLQRILSFLIDTLDFKHSNLSFPYGINIIIKKVYEKDVNLNDLTNHFDEALKD